MLLAGFGLFIFLKECLHFCWFNGVGPPFAVALWCRSKGVPGFPCSLCVPGRRGGAECEGLSRVALVLGTELEGHRVSVEMCCGFLHQSSKNSVSAVGLGEAQPKDGDASETKAGVNAPIVRAGKRVLVSGGLVSGGPPGEPVGRASGPSLRAPAVRRWDPQCFAEPAPHRRSVATSRGSGAVGGGAARSGGGPGLWLLLEV